VNQEPIQLKGRGEEDKSTKETQKEHPDRWKVKTVKEWKPREENASNVISQKKERKKVNKKDGSITTEFSYMKVTRNQKKG
jgi:hypothetical protein